MEVGFPEFPIISLLVVGLRRGDGRAEADFVASFEPRVRARAASRLGDEDAARDIAQEALTRGWCAIREGRVRREAALAAFLDGIAVNLIREHLRAEKRRPRTVPIVGDLAVPLAADPIEAAERGVAMSRAGWRLPTLDRRILYLTLVENLKPGAIAKRLALSSERVQSRKSRATREVARLIREASGVPPARPPDRGRK